MDFRHATLWHWTGGRQGTGYRQLLLARGSEWDASLLDYPRGSHVPPHRDAVPGERHFRANLVLWGDVDAFDVVQEDDDQVESPGDVWVDGVHALRRRWRRLVVFRPDLLEHGVRRVASRRVVLSVGWVRACKTRPIGYAAASQLPG